MREHEQLAQLRKMRGIATGLFVLMTILFVSAKALQSRYAWLSLVGAFAEAAMVGALADWFAVTALFRRPLGLPIPHTAIIPENKDRIGESLANFLEHNFMTQEVLTEEFSHVDFAGASAAWLTQPDNRRALTLQLINVIPALLHMIEDDDVARYTQSAMASSLQDIKFAPLLAEILSVLVAGQQHQWVFDRMVVMMAGALERNKQYIRQKVHDKSPRWMPKAIDEKFFERLIEGAQSTLDEMQQPDSEWRASFQTATEEFIKKLKTSSDYEEKFSNVITQSLEHPLFRNYIDHVWQQIRQRLLTDIAAPDSQTVARLDRVIHSFSQALMQDLIVRNKLNHWIRAFTTTTIAARRDVIATLIKRIIRKWDGDTVSRKIELHVGKDLQYIRINGTLVGGMVGLILYLVSRLLA